jgi:hypothetical protein
MPSFSLRRWLTSVTLISAGFVALAVTSQMQASYSTFPVAAVCWLVGGPALGAGILAPFKHELVGAIIGFLLMVLWTALIAATIHGIGC